MNQDEVVNIVTLVCDAFPGVKDLLDKNPSVIKAWGRTLDGITYDEGMKVLDDWITAKIENAPTGFERERVALNMRGYALGNRDKAARQTLRDQVSQDAADKKYYRTTRSAAYTQMAPILAEVGVLSNQYNQGQITIEERDRQTDVILHRSFKAIDERG